MKFTSIRTDKENQQHVLTRDAEWFLERIKHDPNRFLISEYRASLRSHSHYGHFNRYHEIPRLHVSCELGRDVLGDLHMVAFNGLVVLDVQEVADADSCEQLKRRAMLLPSTWAAFTGASGRSVKILVRIEAENGIMPTSEADAEDLYVRAYRQVAPVYDGVLSQKVTRMEPTLMQGMLMPLDEHPLTNLQAAPLRISAATSYDVDADEEMHLLALPEPQRDYREVEMETYAHNEQLYERAVAKTEETLGEMKRNTNEWWQSFTTGVATEMAQTGIGEEETVCHLWNHLKFKDEPGLTQDFVRTVVEAVYADHEVMHKRGRPRNTNDLMGELIRRMQTRYVFRHNTIMGYTEYRPNHTWATPWRPVTEQVVNTFTIDLHKVGLNIWDRDVRRYINSTHNPTYNPIEEYLLRCEGRWDGRDRISALAATIPTDQPLHWAKWFHVWLLAMVAQWQGRDQRFGNALVPLLVSPQGMHKSTFCRNLLPRELRSWGYTDNLSLSEERPVHQAMAQMLLINLDEFNRISPQKQQGFLKNIVQLPSVKVRRPYAKLFEEVPRLASFIATTNMTDVLTDPSGSRRFIGVRVTGDIDVSKTPNHEQLFAQALHELDHGARYWLNDDETAALMASNNQFQRLPDALQYVLEYFEAGSEAEAETAEVAGSEDCPSGSTQWFTTAALSQAMRRLVGSAFTSPALSVFGRQLQGIEGILRRHTKNGTQYLLRRR